MTTKTSENYIDKLISPALGQVLALLLNTPKKILCQRNATLLRKTLRRERELDNLEKWDSDK